MAGIKTAAAEKWTGEIGVCNVGDPCLNRSTNIDGAKHTTANYCQNHILNQNNGNPSSMVPPGVLDNLSTSEF